MLRGQLYPLWEDAGLRNAVMASKKGKEKAHPSLDMVEKYCQVKGASFSYRSSYSCASKFTYQVVELTSLFILYV